VLAPVAALIDTWFFTDLPTDRAANAAELPAIVRSLSQGHLPRMSCHSDPSSALREALAVADPADRIVVFGSFYTVGGVLQAGVHQR
jgi:dihydrofolate synthase / folylpolyglutamate synthase